MVMYAMTNGLGNRATVIDQISDVNINDTPIRNIAPRKKVPSTGTLSNLAYNTLSFSLLAQYIINKLKLRVRTEVTYGTDGRIRWIELGDTTYCVRNGGIYEQPTDTKL